MRTRHFYGRRYLFNGGTGGFPIELRPPSHIQEWLACRFSEQTDAMASSRLDSHLVLSDNLCRKARPWIVAVMAASTEVTGKAVNQALSEIL